MTTTTVQRTPFALALTLALTTLSAVGCDVGTKPVGTDETGEDETADGGSMEEGQTTTTGGEEESGGTTGTETGGATTDGDATTETGEEDGWEAICTAYCGVLTSCDPEAMGDLTCAADCLEELEVIDTEYPVCVPLYVDLYGCIGGLNCEQFATNEGCTEEVAALGECGDLGCETSLSSSRDQSSCDFWTQCTLGPLYAITCEGDTCVCTVNEMEVASCANDGAVCGADPFFDLSPINDCCGWELTED